MSKHERNCVEICRGAGLLVLSISTRGKHLKIMCRQGMVVCPCTPSGQRWTKNMRSVARRLAKEGR
jgi:hypothetical protein